MMKAQSLQQSSGLFSTFIKCQFAFVLRQRDKIHLLRSNPRPLQRGRWSNRWQNFTKNIRNTLVSMSKHKTALRFNACDLFHNSDHLQSSLHRVTSDNLAINGHYIQSPGPKSGQPFLHHHYHINASSFSRWYNIVSSPYKTIVITFSNQSLWSGTFIALYKLWLNYLDPIVTSHHCIIIFKMI